MGDKMKCPFCGDDKSIDWIVNSAHNGPYGILKISSQIQYKELFHCKNCYAVFTESGKVVCGRSISKGGSGFLLNLEEVK